MAGRHRRLGRPLRRLPSSDPQLAPLAPNAPRTPLTHALLNSSAARDHGDPVSCAGFPVDNLDRRGVPRPDDGDEVCDIGAYEASRPMLFLPLVSK